MTISITTSKKYYGKCSPSNLVCLAVWLRCLTLPQLTWPHHFFEKIVETSDRIWENQKSTMICLQKNCWSSKCHQFVFLSFKFSHFMYILLYTPFPTPVFCREMIFSTRVSSYFDPEISLVKVWDAIFVGKRSRTYSLYQLVSYFWNHRKSWQFWPFEMVKTWPFLEGCSCPPTIGDQKVTDWNHIASYYQPQNNARFFDAKHSKDTICSGNFMICVISSYLFLGVQQKFSEKNHPGPSAPAWPSQNVERPMGPDTTWPWRATAAKATSLVAEEWTKKKDEGIFLVIFDVISAWNP